MNAANLYDACLTFKEDIPFFLEEALGVKGPVLELMCGTGRVSVPLLEAGVPLTCADTSEEMLAVLRDKLEVRQLEAPVVTLHELEQSSEKFTLILAPLGGFARLTEPEAQSTALKLVSRKLDVRGLALCALDNPHFRTRDAKGDKKLLGKHTPRGGGGKVIAAWVREQYEPQSGILTTDYYFEQYGRQSMLETITEYRLVERLVEPAGFSADALRCGLKTRAVYGDFRRAPFDPERSRVAFFVLNM